jgi:RNA recognition motif-containing protein
MGTRLYVGNLPFSADEHQVREMGSPEDAEGAISDLDGQEFGGRVLKVNEARERTDRGGGRGF